jgi:hypothetical protein
LILVGEGKLPPAIWVEMSCPEHGLERFKIKVIKKYNVSKELIEPKFRTKPRHELSGVVVGKSVGHQEVRDYLVGYFSEAGMMDKILSMRFQL